MFPVQHKNGAVPLPAADLLAHTVSTPKQCERCKESLAPHAFQIPTVFSGFEDTGEPLFRSQRGPSLAVAGPPPPPG